MTSGKFHWLAQRITAVLLLPLIIWFLYYFKKIIDYDLNQISNFFNSYANLLILLSSLLLMIYHGKLGMNTIIEDYISQKNLRKKILFANEYLSYILMFISIASIILLYF